MTKKKEPAKDLKTKAAAGTKKVKPVKVERDHKHGVTRPRVDSKTGRVWAIADEQSKLLKAPAGRKLVLDLAIAEKINPATAATQYGRWRKYNGLEGKGTS